MRDPEVTIALRQHTMAQEYLHPEFRSLRHDTRAEINVGMWVGLVIGSMVLVLIVAAVWSDFTSALADYAANETTFGPVLQTVVPILIGAGILLLFVYVFLKQVQ